MTTEQWLIFTAVVIIIMIFVYYRNKRQILAEKRTKIKKSFGRVPARKLSTEELEAISSYYRNVANGQGIDDITWNDLDMDRVFCRINNTFSSVGQEVLYKRLRLPQYEERELLEFDRLVNVMEERPSLRESLSMEFINLGRAKKISISDYIEALSHVEKKNSFRHYLCWFFIVLAVFVIAFVSPAIGIFAVIGALGYTVISYYSEKAEVEPYFICVNHIVKITECALDAAELNASELEKYNTALREAAAKLEPILKSASLLGTASGMDGSLSGMLMDYIRMLTHIDLIQFNKAVSMFAEGKRYVYEIIEILGTLESAIAVASFRKTLPFYSIPKLSEGSMNLEADALYHPLIENAIANSIHTRKSVLLTGSNASGKSTFLKTVAINAILSQTIYTSTAKNYHAGFFRIYSSMALRDDLQNNSSYYIVEITSLKRILDATAGLSHGNRQKNIRMERPQRPQREVPVLCFIDEVLRGTNTVERIAASTQIMKSLSEKQVICFAATHDIELTDLLERDYDNYHFEETVENNEVHFDYRLHSGKANTRNAIRLLGMMGYSQQIIDSAEKMALGFMKTGSWKQ